MKKFKSGIVMSIIVIGTIVGSFALAFSGSSYLLLLGILLILLTAGGIDVYCLYTSINNEVKNTPLKQEGIEAYINRNSRSSAKLEDISHSINNEIENISLKQDDEIETYNIDRNPKASAELEDIISHWDQVILGLNADDEQENNNKVDFQDTKTKVKVRKRTRDNFD